MSQPGDLLFGVLASQLGYCTPDDVLSASRELVGQSDATLADVLERRGLIDGHARRLVARLADRAERDSGGDPARPLELLPLGSLRGGPRVTPTDPIARMGTSAAVDEQPDRYHPTQAAADAPLVLGGGRTGRVVLWEDTVLGRDVAAKLAVGDEQLLFEEARLMGQLEHPAVVPVYELGRRPSGELYCTMQRVTGRLLTHALAEARTLDQRLALLPAFLVACRCVTAAHEEGVVHRDLSSDRVVLGRFGEVYVLDWGLARRGEQRSEERRVDLKCLGDMLGALLSGPDARPLRGAPNDLLAIARRTRLPPQEGGLDSVHALTRELEAFLDGRRVASYRYSAVELVRCFVTRNRVFTAAMAGVVALLAVTALAAQAQVRRERDQARQFAQRFLDDVASQLTAVPGEEALVKAVTSSAVAHYERTTELDRAPAEVRVRLARAMLRLADVAVNLGRGEDARAALAFARRLSAGLLAQREDAPHLLLQAGCHVRDASLARLERAGTELASLEQGLVLAEQARALEPSSAEANRLAASLSREVAGLVEPARAGPLLEQALRYGAAALAAAPDDVEALVSHARSLSLMATTAELAADRARRMAHVEQALGLLRTAQLRTPDSEAVRVAKAEVLVQWAALLESGGEVARARQAFVDARQVALDLLRHRPDTLAVFAPLIQAEVNLGLAKDAWHHLQVRARKGPLNELEGLAPAVAFLAGADEEAIRLARAPGLERSGASLVYRALAAAMLGRPADAGIAARAARGRVSDVPWRPYAVFGRVVTSGQLEQPGRRAVYRFALAWDAALPAKDVAPRAAALERLIAELEAQVPR